MDQQGEHVAVTHEVDEEERVVLTHTWQDKKKLFSIITICATLVVALFGILVTTGALGDLGFEPFKGNEQLSGRNSYTENCALAMEVKQLAHLAINCSETAYTQRDGSVLYYVVVTHGTPDDCLAGCIWPTSHLIVDGVEVHDFFVDMRADVNPIPAHGNFCEPDLIGIHTSTRQAPIHSLPNVSRHVERRADHGYQWTYTFDNYNAAAPSQAQYGEDNVPTCYLDGTLDIFIVATSADNRTESVKAYDDRNLSYSYSVAATPQLCASGQSGLSSSTCQHLLAIQTGNEEYCAGKYEAECYSAIAIQRHAAELCSLIEVYGSRTSRAHDVCIIDLALLEKDRGLCGSVQNALSRNGCFVKVDMLLGIYDGYSAGLTREALTQSVMVGDVSWCDKIKYNEGAKDKCVAQVAAKTMQDELCDRILDSFQRDLCRYDVAIEKARSTGDLSYCDTALKPEICRKKVADKTYRTY